MERNHCSHLEFPIDTILPRFDPEVNLLLQSKFRLKATKDLGRDVEKLIFKMAAVAAILDFLSAHLHVANLFLLSALMFIIKFSFNWIIEEMSKI